MKTPYVVRNDKEKGRQAFRDGIERAKCPFPAKTLYADYWLKGWDEEQKRQQELKAADDADAEQRHLEMERKREFRLQHWEILQRLDQLGIDPYELKSMLDDLNEYFR